MNKLLKSRIRKLASTESGRLEILGILDEQMCIDYNEQTLYGNVYNFYTEFILANKFVRSLVASNDKDGLAIIKRGINNTFESAIEFTRNDIRIKRK